MDGRVAPSVPAADTGNPGGCSFNEVPAVNTLTLFMCIFVLYVACMWHVCLPLPGSQLHFHFHGYINRVQLCRSHSGKVLARVMLS